MRDMLDASEPYPLSAWESQLKRIRTRHFCPDEMKDKGGANRYAVRLAEAKRKRAGLDEGDAAGAQ